MSLITLGEVIRESKSASVLGIADRDKIVTYIKRALDLGAFESNYDPWVGMIDLCADRCGWVTLPSFVGTVLMTNVNGVPSYPRDKWFQFALNGPGSNSWASYPSVPTASGFGDAPGGGGYGFGGGIGAYTDYNLPSPTFQDITIPSALACICDVAADAQRTPPLQLSVQGTIITPQGYQQQALTTDPSDPNTPSNAVFVPLGFDPRGLATSDPKVTIFQRITQVIKPVTQGNVRLYAVAPVQGAELVLIGDYGPAETRPQYQRIRVSTQGGWVRVMYRLKTPDLLFDHDVIPIQSLDAMLGLLRSVRYNDVGDYAKGDAARQQAVRTLNQIQSIQNGPCAVSIQMDPSWGAVAMDLR